MGKLQFHANYRIDEELQCGNSDCGVLHLSEVVTLMEEVNAFNCQRLRIKLHFFSVAHA